MSQIEFAESLGLSSGFMSDIESGKAVAGNRFLKNIYLKHKVLSKYLFLGEGPIFENEENGDGVRMDFDEDGEIIKEMLELFKKSSLVRLSVLHYFRTYKFEKKALIAQELKESTPEPETGEEKK